VGKKVRIDSDRIQIESDPDVTLPHFNLDTNANTDLIGYEYKTDSSNPVSNPNTFLI